MNIYFFRTIHTPYNEEFNTQNRLQNARVLNIFAGIIIIVASCVRLFVIIPNKQHLAKYPTHSEINLLFITTSLFFGLLLFWLSKQPKPQFNRIADSVAWVFSLVFTGGGIWVSFIAQHNPSNTFTLVFIGLFTIASTTVFSLRQIIGIIILCIAVYICGVIYFEVKPELLRINIVLFTLILICFFAISRLSYSIHANYFIKLKTIEEKNKAIEAADHSKNEILGIVAHDLRSPIANIRSLIELMQMEETTKEEKNIYFNHINACCNKAEFIIKDIIEAAQEEAATGILHWEPVNINTMLAETQRSFQRLISSQQKISLSLPNTEIILQIQKDKLQRVFDNLLTNAIKFTHQHTGIISIELEKQDQLVLIKFKDNGIGIPQSHIPYIFDKFTQSGRIGLNAEPSIGLGLHISKQIIEKHGGAISVLSEEHKGSEFDISLPINNTKQYDR